MKLLFMAVALVLVIVFAPFLTIWSLNTLFVLNIPYTLLTWVAIIWLQLLLIAPHTNKN